MRLIDADALIADIKECIEANDGNCEWEQVEGLEVALSCVDDATTIEPERKKGEWLVDPNEFDEWYCCSVCHKGLTMFDGTYDFCPNCGADMRGGSE